MDGVIDIIAILSIFVFPLIVVLLLLIKRIASTHKERMNLISQGVIPPTKKKNRKNNPNRIIALRNGIISVSISLGIIVGVITVENVTAEAENLFLLIVASIAFFLEVGYIIYFIISNKINIKEEGNCKR